MENVNWLSFILATLTPMILGFIWYHPKVFGTAWMHSLGLTEEKLKQGNMGVTMGVSLLMSALLAFFLMGFNNGHGQEAEFDTFKHGAFHGLLLAITVGLPVLITNGLFEQKNGKNLMINAAYWLLTFILMGGILDAMNHWPNEI